MSRGGVHIDRLRLVTPLAADRACGLGERTARKLLELLESDGLDGEIGDVTLQVSRDEAADTSRLAHKLAAEIRRRAR